MRLRPATIARLRSAAGHVVHSSTSQAQLLRFSIVGAGAFVLDVAVLHLMLTMGLDPYSGRLISFLVGNTWTFLFNRNFTFKDRRRTGRRRQWIGFLAVNGVGGVVNYSVYAGLVATMPLVAAWPMLGVAAGSISGLAFNFTLSRRLVFKSAVHQAAQAEQRANDHGPAEPAEAEAEAARERTAAAADAA